MNNIKSFASSNYTAAVVIVKNVFELADAVALTAVSGYAIYQALANLHKSFWYYGLLFAGVLIALQAFVLLVRHFNKQPTKG